MKFRFRWIPFVAAVIVAVIGFSLGQWQTRRALEKETIEARMTERESAAPIELDGRLLAPADAEYRRIRVRGHFLRDWPIYLDNRPYKGEAGFHVLMPLRIFGSQTHLLVMRGWAPRDVSDRTRLPVFETPDGLVDIEGIARSGSGQVLQLGEPTPLRPGAIVQNADIAAFEQVGKWRMQPFVLQQSSDMQDGLVRDWLRPSTGVEKHRGYAFQWYALAATALIFFVVTGFRRGSK
jgi:cytochrome oxidase assembly protein ShyY1